MSDATKAPTNGELSFEDWWEKDGWEGDSAYKSARAAWEAALAQQAQPDYRCVMCNKPIPVGCKDCTEYAYDAVGYPQRAQPEMPTREQIEALRERVPVRTDSGNMDLAAGWCAALDTILAKWFS